MNEMSPERQASLEEGRRLAEVGSAQALNAKAAAEWKIRALSVLEWFIRNGEDFSSDDIAEVAGEPPNPNAMGGLFHGKKDRMRAVGYTQTTRKEGHSRVIRIWRGL